MRADKVIRGYQYTQGPDSRKEEEEEDVHRCDTGDCFMDDDNVSGKRPIGIAIFGIVISTEPYPI